MPQLSLFKGLKLVFQYLGVGRKHGYELENVQYRPCTTSSAHTRHFSYQSYFFTPPPPCVPIIPYHCHRTKLKNSGQPQTTLVHILSSSQHLNHPHTNLHLLKFVSTDSLTTVNMHKLEQTRAMYKALQCLTGQPIFGRYLQLPKCFGTHGVCMKDHHALFADQNLSQ